MSFELKTLRYKGNVVFEKLSMPRFKRIPKLYEGNETCFMFIETGAYSVRTQDALIRFDSQNALFAKCFNYFFETDEEQWAQSEIFSAVGVIFHQEIIEEVFDLDLAKSTFQSGYKVKKVKVDKLLENFKQSIHLMLDNPEIADDALILIKLREFVQLLMRQDNAPSILDFFAPLFRPVDYDLKKTVESNLYANLKQEEFAKLCNMSTSSFKRKFKVVYKEPFKQYILKRKINRASNLLASSQKSITEIAFDCGFDTISSFNRNFKKQTNQSPSSFRNQSH